MPRPKGSKVVLCECGSRIVGMPGDRLACPGCNKRYTIPKGETKKAAVKKAAKKAPVKKAAPKKVAKKATKKR